MTVTAARPTSTGEAAELLRTVGRPVRPRGGGTKPWGPSGDEVALETSGLDRILEHNVGDFTAVLEAGLRVADAQAAFAREGQMLALDPPLGEADAATIGGLVATADSGPLRHRFGAARDLVVGITVVLSDGTVAKAGGKVIKNVAGYDLGKLFAGSFGTLGLIASVAVRLHPLPTGTATARGVCDDPDALAAAARRLATLPLEADSMDVAWAEGRGALLTRFGGAAADHQAEAAVVHMRGAGLDAGVVADDGELWAQQRARQRAPDGVALKLAGVPTELAAVLRAADAAGATAVSRAALGLSWLALPGREDATARVTGVRSALPGATVTVLDGAEAVEDPWPEPAPAALAVMRRLKQRFDPAGLFRPGAFVGGI